MSRINLEQAKEILTRENTVTIEREEGAWVARNKGNKHVIRRFSDGWDVCHCAMYVAEVGKPATESLKGDEAQEWWDARMEQKEHEGRAKYGTTVLKAKMRMAEEILALRNYDAIIDYCTEVRNDCSERLAERN